MSTTLQTPSIYISGISIPLPITVIHDFDTSLYCIVIEDANGHIHYFDLEGIHVEDESD